MGHWDAIYRDRSLGRTTTSSGGVVGGVTRSRSEEVLFDARFACPMCGNFLAPGVQCDPCSAWAVDSTSRLRLSAERDSLSARFARWRRGRAAYVRRAAGMVRGTIVAVHEDSTPADPARLVAAYASREDGAYHTVCGAFAVEFAGRDPYRTVTVEVSFADANLVVPSLARGERRELALGDSVVLTGKLLDRAFYGDVWLERA
ncbi:MAG: hypothetical protein AB8H86_18905 [Polyangiales bacterium]